MESVGRVPLAYVVTLAAMIFTARSYARMAAAYPVAGSAYAYTQRTFGPPVGFLAGWSLLLDYLFLPMLNYLVIGLYLNAAVPAIPQWLIVVVTIAIVSVLNIIGIVSVARANLLIIAIQAIFIVVFVVMAVAAVSGSGSVDVMAPFRGDGTEGGMAPVLAGAAILCLSFLGFDAVSTLSEEARNARRDVPRAIMLATIICGVLFIILSYVSQLVFPSNAFADVDSGSLDVMQSAGGAFLAAFFTAAYVAGASGSALTSQASLARILYAMGRDGVLPRKVFGHVSVGSARRPGDPGLGRELRCAGGFLGGHLTVIKHHFVDAGEKNVVNNLVLPLIGFVLTVWLWTSLSAESLTIGLIWLAIGFLWLLGVTRGFRRPTPVLDLEELPAQPAKELTRISRPRPAPAPAPRWRGRGRRRPAANCAGSGHAPGRSVRVGRRRRAPG